MPSTICGQGFPQPEAAILYLTALNRFFFHQLELKGRALHEIEDKALERSTAFSSWQKKCPIPVKEKVPLNIDTEMIRQQRIYFRVPIEMQTAERRQDR